MRAASRADPQPPRPPTRAASFQLGQPAPSFLPPPGRVPPITPASTQSSPHLSSFPTSFASLHLTSPTRPTKPPYPTLSPIEFLGHDPKRTDRGVPLCWIQLLGPGRDKGHAGLTTHQKAGLSSRPIRLCISNSRPPKHLRDGTKTTGRTPHHSCLSPCTNPNLRIPPYELVPAAGAARRMKH